MPDLIRYLSESEILGRGSIVNGIVVRNVLEGVCVLQIHPVELQRGIELALGMSLIGHRGGFGGMEHGFGAHHALQAFGNPIAGCDGLEEVSIWT